MNTIDKIIVRPATEAEWLEIVTEPQIASLIRKDAAYNEHCHLVLYNQYRLLATFWETTEEGIYEVHIACPKASIRASRVLTLGGLQWLASPEGRNAKAAITNCPEGTMANLCRKLGYKEIRRIKDILYFILNLTTGEQSWA